MKEENDAMEGKENKGGILKNSQIENDLKAKNKSPEKGYVGLQDTGDTRPRQIGKETQKKDGRNDGNGKTV